MSSRRPTRRGSISMISRPVHVVSMWSKAASLRAAFPEEADYTTEEMEDKVIEADGCR